MTSCNTIWYLWKPCRPLRPRPELQIILSMSNHLFTHFRKTRKPARRFGHFLRSDRIGHVLIIQKHAVIGFGSQSYSDPFNNVCNASSSWRSPAADKAAASNVLQIHRTPVQTDVSQLPPQILSSRWHFYRLMCDHFRGSKYSFFHINLRLALPDYWVPPYQTGFHYLTFNTIPICASVLLKPLACINSSTSYLWFTAIR